MKNRNIVFVVGLIIMVLICLALSSNSGLKGFEKEISKYELPENVEKIAIKSGIGDSGGNGDYSTYRVVLVVKTGKTIDELTQYFEKRNLTYKTYVTNCENKEFKSDRQFKLVFNELNEIKDFSNYFFIEFIK